MPDTVVRDIQAAERLAHLVNDHGHDVYKLASSLFHREDEHDYQRDRAHKLARDVSADDDRVKPLLKQMYDVMTNYSSEHLWVNFMDAIDGIPDFRRKTYGGVVTLKFYFSDLEIDGTLEGYEIEEAIVEAIESDLQYRYADESEVEYDEE
jgi:hypothetical protein